MSAYSTSALSASHGRKSTSSGAVMQCSAQSRGAAAAQKLACRAGMTER